MLSSGCTQPAWKLQMLLHDKDKTAYFTWNKSRAVEIVTVQCCIRKACGESSFESLQFPRQGHSNKFQCFIETLQHFITQETNDLQSHALKHLDCLHDSHLLNVRYIKVASLDKHDAWKTFSQLSKSIIFLVKEMFTVCNDYLQK